MADAVSPIEIQKALSGVDYPAERDALVEHARSAGAPDDVVSALEALPDRSFDGPTGVNEAVAND